MSKKCKHLVENDLCGLRSFSATDVEVTETTEMRVLFSGKIINKWPPVTYRGDFYYFEKCQDVQNFSCPDYEPEQPEPQAPNKKAPVKIPNLKINPHGIIAISRVQSLTPKNDYERNKIQR